MSLEG